VILSGGRTPWEFLGAKAKFQRKARRVRLIPALLFLLGERYGRSPQTSKRPEARKSSRQRQEVISITYSCGSCQAAGNPYREEYI